MYLYIIYCIIYQTPEPSSYTKQGRLLSRTLLYEPLNNNIIRHSFCPFIVSVRCVCANPVFRENCVRSILEPRARFFTIDEKNVSVRLAAIKHILLLSAYVQL